MTCHRIGLIGLGNMGLNHLRVIAALPQFYKLTAVYDPNPAATARAARLLTPETMVSTSLDQLLRAVEVLVVAVPTPLHGEVAARTLAAGKVTLVEKPIAPSLSGARLLTRLELETGSRLFVGHVERFNPVVTQAQEVLAQDPHPLLLEVERSSPYSSAAHDSDVIADLMIHDLDLAASLLGPLRVRCASAASVLTLGQADLALALLTAPGGQIVQLKASRVGHFRRRALRLLTPNCELRGDLIRKEVQIARSTAAIASGGAAHLTWENEECLFPYAEPLQEQLIALAGELEGSKTHLCTAEEATRAVALAEEVRLCLQPA